MAPVSDDDSVERKLPESETWSRTRTRDRSEEWNIWVHPSKCLRTKELFMLESRDLDTLEILSIKLQYLNDSILLLYSPVEESLLTAR